jgi:hypothetical protein
MMGGCGAESREGTVWGEGDRDLGGHGVRGRSCARCFATQRSETTREGSGRPPNRTIPSPGWIFFLFLLSFLFLDFPFLFFFWKISFFDTFF